MCWCQEFLQNVSVNVLCLWSYSLASRFFRSPPAHNLDQQHNSGHVLQLLKPETPTCLLLFSKYFCSSKLHSYIFKKSVSSNYASVTCSKADGLAHVCVPSRFFFVQLLICSRCSSFTFFFKIVCVCQVVSFLSNSSFVFFSFAHVCVCQVFSFCPHFLFPHLEGIAFSVFNAF